MGLFGKSFEEKVHDALGEIEAMGLGVKNLGAKIEGEMVTLTGDAPSMEAKARVMAEFNTRVKTDNTLNAIEPRSVGPVDDELVDPNRAILADAMLEGIY